MITRFTKEKKGPSVSTSRRQPDEVCLALLAVVPRKGKAHKYGTIQRDTPRKQHAKRKGKEAAGKGTHITKPFRRKRAGKRYWGKKTVENKNVAPENSGNDKGTPATKLTKLLQKAKKKKGTLLNPTKKRQTVKWR